MKKLLAVILCLITLSATARDTVTLVYPWTASDPAANYDRTLVEEANRIQDKYVFVFETKPGAGGSVATNYVLNNPNTILSTSSPFFIRPVLYPNESYDINKFTELMTQCSSRIVVSSVKYKSWQDVPKNIPLTIGVSGLGTTTHLVAAQLSAKYPNLQVVPFKSTTEALLSTISNNTDFAIGFIADTKSWVSQNRIDVKVNVLGVTGPTPINGYPTLISQGFNSNLSTMVPPYHLVVPKTVSDERVNEWREILQKASTAKSVHDSYEPDHCELLTVPDNKLQTWFSEQTIKWHRLAQGIKIE